MFDKTFIIIRSHIIWVYHFQGMGGKRLHVTDRQTDFYVRYKNI